MLCSSTKISEISNKGKPSLILKNLKSSLQLENKIGISNELPQVNALRDFLKILIK